MMCAMRRHRLRIDRAAAFRTHHPPLPATRVPKLFCPRWVCVRLIGNRSSLRALEANATDTTADIERRWGREKLSLVPGSALLDELFMLYGLRFDKMRDSSRLASYLTKSELDGELRSLIEGIGGP